MDDAGIGVDEMLHHEHQTTREALVFVGKADRGLTGMSL